ncbi:MAG: hypothetical protein JWP47_1127 [Polaromonas sp.]|nr:hypothetical protein [Polaromonas sp.]
MILLPPPDEVSMVRAEALAVHDKALSVLAELPTSVHAEVSKRSPCARALRYAWAYLVLKYRRIGANKGRTSLSHRASSIFPRVGKPSGLSGIATLLRAAGMALAMAGLAACASKPEAPIIAPLSGPLAAETARRMDALLPVDVLILGEQHDAAQHQQIEQGVIANLAARGVLAAVALEMADTGVTTAKLHPTSREEEVRAALRWNDAGWPWSSYGPAVMTAVRAGVPVMGANLPRGEMRASMADSQLDARLPGPALKAQQQLIRLGHCNLLPESQITPMTRVQMARDISMADALGQVAVPGKVVVLLAGSVHANRLLGVPRHLPDTLRVKSVRLLAGEDQGPGTDGAFDTVWATPALPDTNHCARLRTQFAPQADAPAAAKP